MAKLSNDGKYVIVEKGDTLWSISQKYLGSSTKYKQLAATNNIKNPDMIYVGEKIMLNSTGTSSTTTTNSNIVSNLRVGLLSTSDNTLFASWSWSKKKTESYKVNWRYDIGDGVELNGSSDNIQVDEDSPGLSQQCTFNIPEGAKIVHFRIKPIAKKKNNSETREWTADWTKKSYTVELPLTTPDKPSIKIEDLKLTATLEQVDIKEADSIIFQVVLNNTRVYKTSDPIKIQTSYASYTTGVAVGNEYKVRCQAYNTKTKLKSDWSDYSENKATPPRAPLLSPTVRATSKNSILVEWDAVPTAKSYIIEYANRESYFDITDKVTSKTVEDGTRWEFTGLQTGKDPNTGDNLSHYFFRVRAVNENGEKSEWSPIADAIIGEKPEAPTTWSSTTTAIVGEPLVLYWVHNPKDGSSQTFAQLEITLDGILQAPNITIENDRPDEDKDKTSFYNVDTSEFAEGTKFEWRVRTAGAALDTEDGGYGDWSVSRTVDIYAPPTIEMFLTDNDGNEINENGNLPLTGFPFNMSALAGPKTQTPVGYYVTIVSNQIYETVDNIGNPKMVNDGEALYSQYFDISSELAIRFGPENINLENGMLYTATCRVTMDSGLSAEMSRVFSVSWAEISYQPDAEVEINTENMTATVRPFCHEYRLLKYKVLYSRGVYTKTEETVSFAYGDPVIGARTDTDEVVYSGVTDTGETLYFCEVLETTVLTDVMLAVYRREYDGRFTEIGSGLDASLNVAVTDPHPALDYARYRIVATHKSTGAVSHYDIPGHKVGCPAIVIQWDEEWTDFEVLEDAIREQPPWSGSLLKLSYNVDVSESPSPDVSFIEYIGREHPVSYYGTQVGESANWSTDIPKSDKETIYALRRLAKWRGNAYVREPSGVGYWAHVNVSFNQKHCDPVVPVSFNIRRVEGGV